MKELKADHWSRIGRIRRTQLRVGKQAFGNAKFLAGRLVADLSSDGAKVGRRRREKRLASSPTERALLCVIRA